MTDDCVILQSPVLRPQPKQWRVIRKPLDGVDGYCNAPDREIELHDTLSVRNLFDTALHEAAHAANPDLSESAIERTVQCQMAVLTHLELVPAEDE